MQGVNVVARPLDVNGNPMKAYTVTAVSGAYFSGNHGNAVNGSTDANGVPLSQWGSDDPSLQGYFDLRYIPLPPGMQAAAYQITFESINPLFIYDNTVGPYSDGSPLPSGTLPPISVPAVSAGMARTLAINPADSAAGRGGMQSPPRPSPHAAAQRLVVRPAEPDRADRLVQLPCPRETHLHGGD